MLAIIGTQLTFIYVLVLLIATANLPEKSGTASPRSVARLLGLIAAVIMLAMIGNQANEAINLLR